MWTVRSHHAQEWWPVFLALILLSGWADETVAQTAQLDSAGDLGIEAATPDLPPEAEAFSFSFDIELPGGTAPSPGTDSIRFQIDGLELPGVTVYGPDQLLPLYRDKLGTEIALSEFYGIARAIERKYRSDGYLLTYAYIPPQTSSDGRFTIQVIEGFVDKVIVKDVPEALRPRLERLLAAVPQARPLNASVIEGALLSANNLPGINVNAVLEPSGRTRGASTLNVNATLDPWDAEISFTNGESDYTGPYYLRASAAYHAYPVLGASNRISVGASSDFSEEKFIGFGHTMPLGDEGRARLDADIFFASSKPGADLEDLEVEASAATYRFQYTYDLQRMRENTISLQFGFQAKNVDTDILGTPLSRDRVRRIDAGVSWDHVGWFGGATRLRATIFQGLPILGASDPDEDDVSRGDAENWFTNVVANASHLQPLFGGLSALVAVNGQYSLSGLYATEEIAYGGRGFGRAYDRAEIAGDHGLAALLELRYPLSRELGWSTPIQTYVFADYGIIWNRDSSGSESLASAGGGVRTTPLEGVNLDVELAQAIGANANLPRDFGETRVIFRMSKNF